MGEDVHPGVDDAEVEVRLVVGGDGQPQQTLHLGGGSAGYLLSKAPDTHLAGGDGERRGGGEARDHRHGDEVYQEAEPEERSQSEASIPAVDQSEPSIHLRRPHARMMRPDRKARRMA